MFASNIEHLMSIAGLFFAVGVYIFITGFWIIIHEYICENCDYHSNDDRIGAMNIQLLGAQYISGIDKPRFTKNIITTA